MCVSMVALLALLIFVLVRRKWLLRNNGARELVRANERDDDVIQTERDDDVIQTERDDDVIQTERDDDVIQTVTCGAYTAVTLQYEAQRVRIATPVLAADIVTQENSAYSGTFDLMDEDLLYDEPRYQN